MSCIGTIRWNELGCPRLLKHQVSSAGQPYKGMSVYAVNDIQKGDQVFNFYTEDGDDDIFVGYGFCSQPGL